VDTSGIENALNQIANNTAADDNSQVLIDAINNAAANGGNSTDLSGLEDLLSQLIETEKSGTSNNVDLSGIETAMKGLAAVLAKNNDSDKLDNIESELDELRSAIAQNQSDMNKLCNAIYDLISQMQSSGYGSSNNSNNADLISALNRLGSMISNSSNSGLSTESLNGLLTALEDINSSLESNSLSSDDVASIVDAINGVQLPDNSETEKMLADTLSNLSDSLMTFSNATKSNNLGQTAMICVAIIAGSVLSGLISRPKQKKHDSADDDDDENQQQGQSNAYQRTR
jgi:hypothetical protein